MKPCFRVCLLTAEENLFTRATEKSGKGKMY